MTGIDKGGREKRGEETKTFAKERGDLRPPPRPSFGLHSPLPVGTRRQCGGRGGIQQLWFNWHQLFRSKLRGLPAHTRKAPLNCRIPPFGTFTPPLLFSVRSSLLLSLSPVFLVQKAAGVSTAEKGGEEKAEEGPRKETSRRKEK